MGFEGMNLKHVDTYTAIIYCGFKDVDNDLGLGNEFSFDFDFNKAKKICQDYCDEIGLCVTVKPTEFIYTNGNEQGIEVGLINYPRFPDSNNKILYKAAKLAEKLMLEFNQYRVSIVCPNKTTMLSNPNKELNDK